MWRKKGRICNDLHANICEPCKIFCPLNSWWYQRAAIFFPIAAGNCNWTFFHMKIGASVGVNYPWRNNIRDNLLSHVLLMNRNLMLPRILCAQLHWGTFQVSHSTIFFRIFANLFIAETRWAFVLMRKFRSFSLVWASFV